MSLGVLGGVAGGRRAIQDSADEGRERFPLRGPKPTAPWRPVQCPKCGAPAGSKCAIISGPCAARVRAAPGGMPYVRDPRRPCPTRAARAEYSAWLNMLARCDGRCDPKTRRLYHDRGIRVYDEWRRDFWAFYAYVGPRPSPRHSLDRIDGSGNYQPGNVRWATPSQQNSNRAPRKTRARP